MNGGDTNSLKNDNITNMITLLNMRVKFFMRDTFYLSEKTVLHFC